MGPGEVSSVSDAGPLIHLAEIGALSLLRIFNVVHVPDAVWLEAVGRGRVPQRDMEELGHLQRHPLPPKEVARFIRDNGLEGLHIGECECLYLCQHIGVSCLLTDDLAVRDVARRLNLTPVGSLGIVVRAYRMGLVSLAEAENHIFQLYEVSSLFVTRAIVEMAVAQLRARSG